MNNLDIFRYICGNVVHPNRQVKITDSVTKATRDYFAVTGGDHNKPFAPRVCCKTYVENLSYWGNHK